MCPRECDGGRKVAPIFLLCAVSSPIVGTILDMLATLQNEAQRKEEE